ncbi:hypothetical protein [Candidatus Poriferisodalis sp.]|uniref:hypothetical protein n=1 Tax=Candidatus Poriferisodalis sp. TaxID=3101277 RepID=UPI003B52E384
MRINESAHRHDVTEDEILHAWHNALNFFDIDINHEPIKSLCIGPDRAANLLEILYLQEADGEHIIHAMPLRPAFRRYLTGERP